MKASKKLTKHARKRMSQRAISEKYIEFILNHGIVSERPGKAKKFCISNEDKKRYMEMLKCFLSDVRNMN